MIEWSIPWIPVARCLPDDARNVLVFAPPPWEGPPVFIAHISWPDGNDEWWWVDESELDWPKETVTHWAALPAPPSDTGSKHE